jgi:ElaB/YqjD/DUF883 family membrane-anchored ribosome-binding protein
MSTLHKSKTKSHNGSHIKEAAEDLLHEGKKMAYEIYEDGLNKVNEAQDNVKEYSDELVKKVQDNPLTSILIAGGIGFLLSSILRK